MGCRISLTLDLDCGRGFFEGMYVFCSKFDSRTSKILFKSRKLRGAWNRNDPWCLGQQPCEGDLSGSSLLLFCKLRDDIDESLVRFAIVFAESRNNSAEVGTVELRGGINLAGEKAFAERTERDEADAELFQRWDDRLFGFAPEE